MFIYLYRPTGISQLQNWLAAAAILREHIKVVGYLHYDVFII